jgi:hypothetical protein
MASRRIAEWAATGYRQPSVPIHRRQLAVARHVAEGHGEDLATVEKGVESGAVQEVLVPVDR